MAAAVSLMSRQLTIRGVTWDHPRAYTCLVAASKLFADDAARNGADIGITWDKRSLQAFADQPIDDLAERYDLIVLDHPHVGQIAESGCLAPLPVDDGMAAVGGSFECYQWQDEQWAYPIDAACQMAVSLPDMACPFPRHWDELLEGDIARFRLLTPLLPVDAFDMMLTLLASRGEEDLPLNDQLFCSEQNGIQALGVLRRLYQAGPEEAIGWNPIRVLEILATEEEFAASPCLFGYINYARPGFRPHRLTYRDLPTFAANDRRRAILGGAGVGVSSKSEVVEAAMALARYLASEPVQSGIYLENEGQPAHRATWEKRRHDPRYAGFMDGAFETMRTAWTRPRAAWFLDFVDDVCAVFPDYFRKGRDDDVFLAEINGLYRHHVRAGKGA